MATTPITFGGLASGMDTNSIVAKLVQIEQMPMTALQTRRTAEAAKQTLVNSLSTQVATLGTALKDLQNPSAIKARTAQVQSGAPFTATAGVGAPTGAYSVMVDQLASAQRTYSDPVATSDTAANKSGAITLTMGGTLKSIQVQSTDTLTDIANNISNAGLNLAASVVYDGTSYHLVINGEATGQSNAIAITDNSGLGLAKPSNAAQAAQDTVAYVDGLQVHSATSTITGIIPGVALTATALSAGSLGNGAGQPISKGGNVSESNVTVGQDQTKIAAGLQSVVDAYNAVMSVVNQQFAPPPPSNGATAATSTQPLAGDSTTRELQSTLLALPSMIGGPAGNAYSSLLDLGISVDSSGTMSLDQSKLQNAQQQNPQAVANLLTGDGVTPGLMNTLTSTLTTFSDFVSGAFTIESQSISDQLKTMDTSISRMQTQTAAYQTQIQNEFNNMEQLISSYNSQNSALSALNANLFNTNYNSGNNSSSSG